jgi:hypothetical protein
MMLLMLTILHSYCRPDKTQVLSWWGWHFSTALFCSQNTDGSIA